MSTPCKGKSYHIFFVALCKGNVFMCNVQTEAGCLGQIDSILFLNDMKISFIDTI